MRKIIVSEFITLDGVIQAPGGADEDTEGGFEHGGWTMPYWDDKIGEWLFGVTGRGGSIRLGRRRGEIHAAAFEPMADDDPNEPGFNRMSKYVVSNTLTSADAWRNSTIISGDVVGKIRELKAQGGGDILVDGSSELVHTLVENGLVDEINLAVYPIVLGSGKKLFPDGTRINMRLADATPVPSGVIMTRYMVDRG
ncbi:MAG TPA: dihydrofolate reductase family protein [Thermomicrobiales bacterium]|nr:dihydrofolate reductase family protein [Thermomicrobiales bacterium]